MFLPRPNRPPRDRARLPRSYRIQITAAILSGSLPALAMILTRCTPGH
ncbi:hypothetical protein [Streptomyces abikoensis]|uniref:Uncharacterized protein n=1 Tax=Streptomyces abikoensis TaxID=97398 RepID=A0ABW7T8R2_9ACTN